MRVSVIGIGGVGGLLAGKLAALGVEVTFVSRGKGLATLQTEGLVIESAEGNLTIGPPLHAVQYVHQAGPTDVIVVATKAWQVAEILPDIRMALGSRTLVIPIQNGIRTLNQIMAVVGERHICGATFWCISYKSKPGIICHIGVPPTMFLGPVRPQHFVLKDVATDFIKCLNRAAIVAEFVPDIQLSLWQKLALVVPLSVVGALSRLSIGDFRSDPLYLNYLIHLTREIVAVGLSIGVNLPLDCEYTTLQFIAKMPPACTASMQRDMMNGLPSEFEYLIGDVLEIARRNGIVVPYLERAYAELMPLEVAARENLRAAMVPRLSED